jgi:hypothetical protein
VMTKCHRYLTAVRRAHGRVDFAEASETGDIPEIIGNDPASTRG